MIPNKVHYNMNTLKIDNVNVKYDFISKFSYNLHKLQLG